VIPLAIGNALVKVIIIYVCLTVIRQTDRVGDFSTMAISSARKSLLREDSPP